MRISKIRRKAGREKPQSITKNSSTYGKTLTPGIAEHEDAKKRLAGLKQMP